jgi:hypothetical protein
MMQNQILVTHMDRGMGVQHILPPTLITMTPASMTRPVSITPHFHLSTPLECIFLSPGT